MPAPISAASAASILLDCGCFPATPDDPALLLALIRAFHASGLRAIEIPADLDAVRIAARDRVEPFDAA